MFLANQLMDMDSTAPLQVRAHDGIPVAVAKIYPVGPAAEEAFDRLIKADDTLRIHRSFLHLDVIKMKSASETRINEELGPGGRLMYQSWIPPSRIDPQFQTVYFFLTFDDPHRRERGLTWRMGSGTARLASRHQGVELLTVISS